MHQKDSRSGEKISHTQPRIEHGCDEKHVFFSFTRKTITTIHPSMGSPYSLFHPERGRSCFMLCKIPHCRQDFQAKKSTYRSLCDRGKNQFLHKHVFSIHVTGKGKETKLSFDERLPPLKMKLNGIFVWPYHFTKCIQYYNSIFNITTCIQKIYSSIS